MAELYDTIGGAYAQERRADPRLAALIGEALGDATSVLNVGAGTGSYEPDDRLVIAAEPSLRMIAQRSGRAPVVRARAEALPLRDAACDAVMAVLTVHHWPDQARGLAECLRVARHRVVLLTWDPASDGFWLVQDYFPEILALDRRIFPSLGFLESVLGRLEVRTVPIPADCIDGFTGAYWRRPRAYLDADVRAGMSTFARIEGVAERAALLRRDLESGLWDRRYGALRSAPAADLGYRLVTARLDLPDRHA